MIMTKFNSTVDCQSFEVVIDMTKIESVKEKIVETLQENTEDMGLIKKRSGSVEVVMHSGDRHAIEVGLDEFMKTFQGAMTQFQLMMARSGRTQ